MTNVLVVDDSAIDRRLTTTLLSKGTDWTVDASSSGKAALEQIETAQPDLVISDLRMPDMDGLELISSLKMKFPAIPVIIITAMGSEELMMEALRNGAASYCPKARLATDLVDVAKNLVAVSFQKKKSDQVLESLTNSRFSFKVENDSSMIPPLIEHIQSHMLGWSETDRLRIGVALDESLLNAMHHGNLEVDSRLRDEGDGNKYRDQIALRTGESPFCERKVHLDVEIAADEIQMRVKDEGRGFELQKVPDPTSPENLEKPSGRGLLLIRTFMSHVIHNEAGNEILMIKNRNA